MLTREEPLRPDWLDLEQRLAKEDSNRQSARSSYASQQPFVDKQRIYQQIIYSEPPKTQSYAPTTAYFAPPTTAYRPPPLQSTPALKASTANSFVLPSLIEGMRPLRSLFPSPTYVTTTTPD